MGAVLISTNPIHCQNIDEGKKTIEVRKSRPKLETPFKVFIYETKRKQIEHSDGCDITYHGRGKVIGEFVCDRIDEIIPDYNPITKKFMYGNVYNLESACLENEQCQEYGKGKPLYGWHISNLKIYDKPKKLSEFYKPVKYDDVCAAKVIHCGHYQGIEAVDFCEYNDGDCSLKGCKELRNLYQITRPPQSWCYVELSGVSE